MLSPSYLIRVLKGMSLDKYKEVLDRTAKFSGMSKAAITADMAKCAVKFGAGYFDYVTFGFWDLTDEQRGVVAHFRNPAMPSVAVTADAAIKIASSRENFATTDTFLEMIGFDKADIRRIKAQEQRARGQAVLKELGIE